MIDYYKILGVADTATLEEIKKSYREKSLKYHPDRTNHLPKSERDGYTTRMKLINEAYEVLKDDNSRKQYDERQSLISTQSASLFVPRSLKQSGMKGDMEGRQLSVSIFETKYVGSSQVEVIVTRNNLVQFIDKFVEAVSEFKVTAQQGSEKHNRIVNKLDDLCIGLGQHKTILYDQNATSEQFLSALQKCAELIQDAQAGSEFKSYRVIAKTVPVLLHVLHGLDVMGNLFNFLIEKMTRIGKGNATPVFKNRDELSIGVFQSTNTKVFGAIEKLKKDVQWFSDGVEKSENQAFGYDNQWQRKK